MAAGGFVVAALWIDTIATELVSIIEYLGLLSGINHTVSFVSHGYSRHNAYTVYERPKQPGPAGCNHTSRHPALISLKTPGGRISVNVGIAVLKRCMYF